MVVQNLYLCGINQSTPDSRSGLPSRVHNIGYYIVSILHPKVVVLFVPVTLVPSYGSNPCGQEDYLPCRISVEINSLAT